jgi:hypothetical protein
MLSFARGRQEEGECDAHGAEKSGFSLACRGCFPYNPVDFVSPVDLQVRGPEFDRLPKLDLAEEAGK